MRRTFLRNERLTLVPKPTNSNSSTTPAFAYTQTKNCPSISIDQFRSNVKLISARCICGVWRCSCARAQTTCHHNYAPELSNADSPEVKKKCWLRYSFVFRRISFSFFSSFCSTLVAPPFCVTRQTPAPGCEPKWLLPLGSVGPKSETPLEQNEQVAYLLPLARWNVSRAGAGAYRQRMVLYVLYVADLA